MNTGAGLPVQGDVFTIAGVFRVHPETKQSTGVLQQFVINAGTVTTTSFPISPAIVTSGALQNVSASPASGAAISFSGTVSTNYGLSLAYQKGAFAFASADMVMPRGVDFAAREAFDGVSMRIVRQYEHQRRQDSRVVWMSSTATKRSAHRSSPAGWPTTDRADLRSRSPKRGGQLLFASPNSITFGGGPPMEPP